MKKILAAALSCTVLLSLSGCKGLDYGKNLQPSETVQSYDAFLKPYYRAFLNEEQATLYDKIKLSLSNPGKKVAVPEGTDVDAIKKCLDYVWLDNPVFPQPSAYDIFLSNYDYIKTTYKKGFGKTDQKAAQALKKRAKLPSWPLRAATLKSCVSFTTILSKTAPITMKNQTNRTTAPPMARWFWGAPPAKAMRTPWASC